MKVQNQFLFGIATLSLYCVILFLLHLYLYNQWLPVSVLLAVAGMLAFYFITLRLGLLALLHPRIFAKVAGILGLVALVYTLYDLTYWCIYQLLPRLNVVLYRPGVTFRYSEFQTNVTSPFATVVTLSVLSVIWTFFLRHKRASQGRLLAQQQAIEDLRIRLSVKQVSPNVSVGSIDGIIHVPSADTSKVRIVLRFDSLLHAEIKDKTMVFQEISGQQFGRISMDKLEEMLPASTFIRIHRSHLINLNYLKTYRRKYVELYHRNDPIPVGAHYQARLEAALRRLRREA